MTSGELEIQIVGKMNRWFIKSINEGLETRISRLLEIIVVVEASGCDSIHLFL